MANFQLRERWLAENRATPRRRRYGAFADASQRFGAIQIAGPGEPIYLPEPMVVSFGPPIQRCESSDTGTTCYEEPAPSKVFPAGTSRCLGSNFGVGGDWYGCYIGSNPGGAVSVDAAHVADEGQGFVVPAQGGIVFYGSPISGKWVQRVMSRAVAGGRSYPCDSANFGPDPAYGLPKECRLAPFPAVEAGPAATYYDVRAEEQLAEERAVAAVQAARDLAAAQLAIEETRATEAAEQARVAENAQAQAAAALAAAETYRQIQEEAQRQAADYAAELAAYAAQAGATQLEREALAEMRAQVEALRQATADAQATEAERAASYQVAESVALTEARRQEAAETRLQIAQEAAYTQAELAAGGGAGAGFALQDLLLYGGLALAGVFLLTKGG